LEKRDKKIRVLVVDDSIMFREVLSRGLSKDPQIEVVASAVDPFDARDKIVEFEPDVMTCDVEMPKMSGIEFVGKLIPQYPIPVIVVSTLSAAVFDAMKAGAVDFVTKPNIGSSKDVNNFIEDMIAKIKIAAVSKVTIPTNEKLEQKERKLKTISEISAENNNLSGTVNSENDKIIAIGASTGGTEAVFNILKYLPSTMPGIIIVQHIPAGFSKMFATRLNNFTDLNVKEAETGDYIERGHALVAPGDKQVIIRKSGKRFKVECFEGERRNGHCPSVDVLFESVAKEAGSKAIGVILTGMGCDGAKGLLEMRRAGASTFGQDEESSVVYGMPKVAYEIGAVEKQLSLTKIPKVLCAIVGEEKRV